jgi:hypothetical protein
MAAHSVTILKEWETCPEYTPERRKSMLHAMDYAPGLDYPQLDVRQWDDLREAIEHASQAELRAEITRKLQAQTVKWLDLGMPDTTEDWRKAVQTRRNKDG